MVKPSGLPVTRTRLMLALKRGGLQALARGDAPAPGSRVLFFPPTLVPQAPVKRMRQRQGAEFCPIPDAIALTQPTLN